MITLEKVDEYRYNVLWENGKQIGTFELGIDGMFYFWNNIDSYGSWTSYSLRLIADKLYEINKPFREAIAEYFKKEREELNCSCGEGVKIHGESYCKRCLDKNPLWCN
jgi:hypothetical protein